MASLKGKVVQEVRVVVQLSATEKRNLAYKMEVNTDDAFTSHLTSELGQDKNSEAFRQCRTAANESRKIINPIANLALKANPEKLAHYQDKGMKKEALMAEILQIIDAETKERGRKAAAKRAENAAKKAGSTAFAQAGAAIVQ